MSVEFGCSRDWKKWNSVSCWLKIQEYYIKCWSDAFQGKIKSTQVGHSRLTQRCDQDSWQYEEIEIGITQSGEIVEAR